MGCVAINDELHKELKIFSAKKGLKIKEIVNTLIKEFLEFGEVNASPIFLSDELHRKLKIFCAFKNLKLKDVVDEAIKEYLNKRMKK